MDKIVLTVLEATLTLYPQAADGTPITQSPVWFGAAAERLRMTESWMVVQTTPSGAPCPINHPLISRHEVRIGRIWMLNASLDDFVPTSGQYVLDIVWVDERTGWWKRRTYYGVTIRERDVQSEGVMESNDEQVFDAQDYGSACGFGAQTPVPAAVVCLWWIGENGTVPLYDYDSNLGLFTEVIPGMARNLAQAANTPFLAQFFGQSSPAVFIAQNGMVNVSGMVEGVPDNSAIPRIDFTIGGKRVASIDSMGVLYGSNLIEGVPAADSGGAFVLSGGTGPALIIGRSGVVFGDLEEA